MKYILFFLALLVSVNIQAGKIGPRLQAELQSRAQWISPTFTQDIPVIITFSDKADLTGIVDKRRKKRIHKAIKALKQQSNTVQKSVRRLLYANWIDQVDELWLINGLAFKAPSYLLKKLSKLPEVKSVELDYQIEALATGTVGTAPAEWNLDMVGAPVLWGLGITGEGTVVANMDTGVDRTDPDINLAWRGGNNSWYDPNCQSFPPQITNMNFSADASCPDPNVVDLSQPRDKAGTSTGHGTETMGVMVGGQAGGTAIGVAPAAQWIAAKIFSDNGLAAASRIHLAFQWLLDPDNDPNTDDAPDVVNASWALTGTAVGMCVGEFEADIHNLKTAGIAVVFAAGNEGANGTLNTSTSPGNNPSGYAVGAINMNGQIASWSSRGPAPLLPDPFLGTNCNDGLFPELVAPGVGITTATTGFLGTPQYTTISGTSFAAPHVAGAMALLKSRIPTLSVAQLEDALLQSSYQTLPDTIPGPDDNYGYGALDVVAAYDLLCPAAGLDSDADGIPDACDNCTLVSNMDQRDTDRDGFGNMCDADFNNDGLTNFTDLGLFKAQLFTIGPDGDFNGDGMVNFTDLGIMKLILFTAPGPSGQVL